ncbi:MAG: hypothetical protein SF069_04465 [Phycisphaerae bacterium]|nr:hypothetical protein [Phycisphaerae bacterium]
MRLQVDKIASVTRNVPLGRDVRVCDRIIAREGYLLAGTIRGEKSVYNTLEDVHGRMVPLHDGDVIVGALGHRNALHGYTGVVPSQIQVGQRIHVLNLGGVLGRCTSENPDVGKPFELEVLGSVQVFPEFEERCGVPAHIGMNAVDESDHEVADIPVVFVAGTCMNSGKTAAASRLIRQLDSRGLRVGGCKLTGVSLRRDTLQMIDYGAAFAVSFTDAGIVTTSPETAAPVARRLINHLARQGAQVIVAELGDGILGEYGVQNILADTAMMNRCSALVLCANDPVGAWGAKEVLHARFGLDIDVVSGPATDNAIGTRFVRESLGLAAINARTNGPELGAFVASKINGKLIPVAA